MSPSSDFRVRGCWLGACVALLVAAGVTRAGDGDADLRARLEEQQKLLQEQQKQIDELKQLLKAGGGARVPDDRGAGDRKDPDRPTGGSAPAGEKGQPEKGPKDSSSGASADKDAAKKADDDAVRKIAAEYLRDNPGAGMPAGVQTGFEVGKGFVIRSTPNPPYVKWDDDLGRIPFELRIRGRIQLDYYNYEANDNQNHQTGAVVAVPPGDFSQLEVKRLRLIFEGTAFDPDLRYHFQLDGNTRGLGGTQNNRILQTSGFPPGAAGFVAPGIGTAVSPIGGGVVVDHAVRLFSAYVAYDFHGCGAEKGCGHDCPEGTYKYAPTYTLIAGKLKPLFGLEEYLGSGNEQFVEFSMADWFFDADDDNLLVAAGLQVKAADDRLFVVALLTNGNESQFPNTQMDNLPGLNVGLWYDFGGSWNDERHRWDLFGDSLADIDYSCDPVVRVGGAANLVPMSRRTLYGDLEQSRVFVMPAGPGGTRLINLFNGGALVDANGGAHAVDKFDSYTYNAFVAAKYRGFSISNEWWLRDLNDFHTSPRDRDQIVYPTQVTRPASATADGNGLFHGQPLVDYGMQLQAGYFLIPKKLEVVGRWSWIRGESGDVNGLGASAIRTIPTVPPPGTTAVRDVLGAFRQYHEANEYAVGINYYFKRQLLKWQTDLSWYEGGNPAGGGQSPAGFIAGVDGWLLRTQLQLGF